MSVKISVCLANAKTKSFNFVFIYLEEILKLLTDMQFSLKIVLPRKIVKISESLLNNFCQLCFVLKMVN